MSLFVLRVTSLICCDICKTESETMLTLMWLGIVVPAHCGSGWPLTRCCCLVFRSGIEPSTAGSRSSTASKQDAAAAAAAAVVANRLRGRQFCAAIETSRGRSSCRRHRLLPCWPCCCWRHRRRRRRQCAASRRGCGLQ